MERWLWFRKENRLEQRRGRRPGGWLRSSCCYPGVMVIGTGAGGSAQNGDRLWRQDPQDLGTHWPREIEGEAEEEAERAGVLGRCGELHLGHPRRDGKYGSSGITPGNAWSPVPGTFWSGRATVPGPVPGSPSEGQAGNSWPRDTLSGVGPSLDQREGCALACSRTGSREGAVEMAEFRELPTPPPPSPWPQLWLWGGFQRGGQKASSLGLGYPGQ